MAASLYQVLGLAVLISGRVVYFFILYVRGWTPNT